jgi:hypothetical protein
VAARSLTYLTGKTLKTVVRDFSTGAERLWNTGTVAFETYNAANIALYGISTPEGSPGSYSWTLPALPALAGGAEYQAITYQIASTSLAVADLPNSVWQSIFGWDGTVPGNSLVGSGLDAIKVETGIASGVLNDAGAALTSINLRQAIAIATSGLGGVLAGGNTTTNAIQPAGLPAQQPRITATVDALGHRTAVSIRVPA